MDVSEVLATAGVILACGLLAVPVALALRVPVMIVFVAAGVLVGPSALDLVSNPLDELGAELIFTFGVSLILFHGGVGVSFRVIRETALGLGMLVIPGVLVTAGVVAVVVSPVFGVSIGVAFLVGSVLAATDPAILIPLFDRIRLRPKVSQTVIAESAFNDPTGTVLALTVASALAAGSVSFTDPVVDFTKSLAIGAACGIAGGLVLALMVSSHRLGIWSESPAAAILGLVALEYFAVDEIGGSAYLAAFVMGLMVGNADLFGIDHEPHGLHAFETFIAQLSEIAVIAVFVTLGINLPLDALREHFLGGLVVMAVFIFVARPLAVLVCLSVDRRARWTRQEVIFLCWCRETGVVPAAVASLLVGQGVPGSELAVAMVAMAIIATLLLQATTAGWLARRLDLVQPVEAEAGV
jgi:cell volume regulation protein A